MTCDSCNGTGMAYRREDKDPYEGYKTADKKPCLQCGDAKNIGKEKVEMTNYNDGKWHGWNGGELPVHPETVVDLTIWRDAYGGGSGLDGCASIKAGSISWSHVNSFRVIKEHKEPREFWIAFNEKGEVADTSQYIDELCYTTGWTCARFREVIEE